MNLRVSSILLSIVFTLSALAQSTNDTQTLRVNSNLVVLDIVVTDNAGQVVTNLTKDDFAVVEDKRPQAIRSFEAIGDHGMPAGSNGQAVVTSAADLKKIDRAPVTILVLDELSTKFENMAYGRYCLDNYLKRQPKVLLQPTILLAVSYGKFQVVHDYSQDRDALMDALHQHKSAYPAQLMRTGNAGYGASERMEIAIESLAQIAKSQVGTPGRKNVVWVGKGFPTFNPQQSDQQGVAAVESILRQTTDLMLRARVTLFVVDPAGIQAGGDTAETPEDLDAMEDKMDDMTPFNGVFSFANLAPATGGRSFLNRNDIDAEIATSVADGGSYYTLSYVPDNPSAAAAKYRRIRIVFKRPGLHAMTRDGYYPPGAVLPASQQPEDIAAAAKMEKAVLQADVINAVMSRMSYNGIDVVSARGDGDTYQLSVKASNLDWVVQDNGQFEADVALYVVSFSDKGKVIAQTALEVRRDANRMPPSGSVVRTMFKLPFQVPSGSVRSRFVVRDVVTGKIGTADLSAR